MPLFFLFSVSQECGCVCLCGLSALHGLGGLSVGQFVAGHLCHAGQGDGHHRVRRVRALRRPGALPQASHQVSHQAFVYVLFLFLILSWFMWQLPAERAHSFSAVLSCIFAQLKSFTPGSSTLQTQFVLQTKCVRFFLKLLAQLTGIGEMGLFFM